MRIEARRLAAVTPRLRRRRGRRARREPVRKAAALGLAHAQSELGPPPQDIVGRHRPFVPDEMLDLALVEAVRRSATPRSLSVAAPDRMLARQGAVGCGQAVGQRRASRNGKLAARSAASRSRWSMREVAAGQRRAARPGRAHARETTAPSFFSASSARWRNVVILPPMMLSSGGSPSGPRARARSRASPPGPKRRPRRSSGRTPA